MQAPDAGICTTTECKQRKAWWVKGLRHLGFLADISINRVCNPNGTSTVRRLLAGGYCLW